MVPLARKINGWLNFFFRKRAVLLSFKVSKIKKENNMLFPASKVVPELLGHFVHLPVDRKKEIVGLANVK